ncbi:MAG: OmpA family protein [Anaeromicrobium sp.]|jgi:chemotaxis protein MotB|uniref:OmpA/MotB family protein n=1 Tax=Anaeromicrobium sp. TaxID=1929132 RepID=UPI0025FCDF09|nr:OmpA family protein [Anaeromicrobium sp.]MCT4592926.1 OmpA family protein [Anaeromicrobium sp.]
MKDSYHNDDDFSSNWLITYSDMVTIILCFFIIFFNLSEEKTNMLYSMKNALKEEVATLSEENNKLKTTNKNLSVELFNMKNIERDIHTSEEEFIKFLRDNNMLDKVNILQNEKGIAIRFKDNVLFSSGDAAMSKEGKLALSKIGDKLTKIDNNIIVEGYTDNLPIQTAKYPSNWELSVARAIEVVKYFTEVKGIDKSRMSVSGYGELNPIDTNDTPKGRSNNRRIEITIIN